ncbi:hypothetical protein ACFQX7_07150 [Luedemannella flava]
MLRRPGMYGGDEVAELLLFEAMAAVDGVLERWTAERESLRASGLCLPTGVRAPTATSCRRWGCATRSPP